MYSVRQWSVRNARLLEWLYDHFEGSMVALHSLWLWLGFGFFICGPIILLPLMLSLSRWTESLQELCAGGDGCECETCADGCDICSAWCCFG